MHSVKSENTKLIHKNLLHFCILMTKDQEKKLRKNPFTIASKRIKYLGKYFYLRRQKTCTPKPIKC